MSAAVTRQYEYGRSDGVADGSADYDWNQALAEERQHEVREEAAYALAHHARASAAYALGYARGYREATAGVPDGRGMLHPVAELMT